MAKKETGEQIKNACRDMSVITHKEEKTPAWAPVSVSLQNTTETHQEQKGQVTFSVAKTG